MQGFIFNLSGVHYSRTVLLNLPLIFYRKSSPILELTHSFPEAVGEIKTHQHNIGDQQLYLSNNNLILFIQSHAYYINIHFKQFGWQNTILAYQSSKWKCMQIIVTNNVNHAVLLEDMGQHNPYYWCSSYDCVRNVWWKIGLTCYK